MHVYLWSGCWIWSHQIIKSLQNQRSSLEDVEHRELRTDSCVEVSNDLLKSFPQAADDGTLERILAEKSKKVGAQQQTCSRSWIVDVMGYFLFCERLHAGTICGTSTESCCPANTGAHILCLVGFVLIECEVQDWHFAHHVWVWFRAEITEICCKFLVRRSRQSCLCQVLVGSIAQQGNLVTPSKCLLQFLCDHNSKHDACLSIYGLWCWIWSHQIIKSLQNQRSRVEDVEHRELWADSCVEVSNDLLMSFPQAADDGTLERILAKKSKKVGAQQ